MNNHYHLLLQTSKTNLVVGMGWLQNTFTGRFNTRHHLWGRLFGDRYNAMLVEDGSSYYYETLLDYIHFNAMRAGLIDLGAGQSSLNYPWSSVAAGYALPAGKRAEWLAAEEEGLRAFGCEDTARGRRRWVQRLDARASQEVVERCGVRARSGPADARRSHLRHGWYWGSQAFAERVMELTKNVPGKERSRGYRASQESRAHGESAAR